MGGGVGGAIYFLKILFIQVVTMLYAKFQPSSMSWSGQKGCCGGVETTYSVKLKLIFGIGTEIWLLLQGATMENYNMAIGHISVLRTVIKKLQKMKKWPYISPNAKNLKIKETFLPSILRVEQSKVDGDMAMPCCHSPWLHLVEGAQQSGHI